MAERSRGQGLRRLLESSLATVSDPRAETLVDSLYVLESRGEHERAADLYVRAATMYPTLATSPGYLMNAGRAFEAAGEPGSARRVYERIRDDYAESAEARDIEFFLARVSE